MSATTNGTAQPKITLYTNHRCPYAHRAHIALEELSLPFEEILIDLSAPRPDWYLAINPRGLVPALKYSLPGQEGTTLTESAVVAQFLADSFPSHLLPASNVAPLFRARVNFFVDAWTSKVSALFFATLIAASDAEREAKSAEWVAAIEREIEPLLADAGPFFGGSERVTMAEVMVAPFVVRWFSFAEEGSLVPGSWLEGVGKLPNFRRWAERVGGVESVGKIYDGEGLVGEWKKKIAEKKAAAGKK